MTELNGMASSPVDEHVIVLDQFTDLGSFVDKISRGVCLEPQTLPALDIVRDTVGENVTKFYKNEVPVENGGVQVLLNVVSGSVEVYGSLTQKNPDALSHDAIGEPNPSNPSEIVLRMLIPVG